MAAQVEFASHLLIIIRWNRIVSCFIYLFIDLLMLFVNCVFVTYRIFISNFSSTKYSKIHYFRICLPTNKFSISLFPYAQWFQTRNNYNILLYSTNYSMPIFYNFFFRYPTCYNYRHCLVKYFNIFYSKYIIFVICKIYNRRVEDYWNRIILQFWLFGLLAPTFVS